MGFSFVLTFLTTAGLLLGLASASSKPRYFVTFSLAEEKSTTTLERLASINEDVYIAYYNDEVGVYGNKHENPEAAAGCHLVVDNINPGLSILYLPKYRRSVRRHGPQRHLVGGTSAWCLTLVAVFMSGKWSNSGRLGKYTAPFDTFYHRCVSLAYQWDAPPSGVYEEFLRDLPDELTLDDVYLFEKWSRRYPKPLYADEKDILSKALICNNIHGKIPLAEPNISLRHCFLNDLMGIDWTPYYRDGIIRHKRRNQGVEEPRKWNYLYAPKSMELSLGLSRAIIDAGRHLASIGKSKKNRAIYKFLTQHLDSIRLHYAVGSISSRGGQRHVNFSFGISFQMEAPVDFSEFEYVAREDIYPACGSRILGQLDPLMHSTSLLNKLEYSELKGKGQHRSWRISVTLDAGVLRKLTAPGNRIYIKVTHMLDRSVFLDRDEVSHRFKLLEKEDLTSIPTSKATPHGLDLGKAEMSTIRAPAISVEDPEMYASALIYHAYIALDPSSLTFNKVEVHYRLTIHTRYMPLNKGSSSTLAALDVEDHLSRIDPRHYDTCILHEPQVYVLKSATLSPVTRVPSHVTQYIAFLRSISFLNLVSIGYTDTLRSQRTQKPDKGANIWHRLYFTERPEAEGSVQVCKRERSGLAVLTNNFSFSRCTVRENLPDAECQQVYMFFSVPVGRYKGSIISLIVAVVISVAVTIYSFIVVSRTFHGIKNIKLY